MTYQYPHIIDNGSGGKIIFKALVQEADGDRLELENHVEPNTGPPLHTHFLQDEGLTIIEGRLAVEVVGEEIYYLNQGQSATFKAGTPHRFWNPGDVLLRCSGWVKPAHNIEYFLTEVYKSTKESTNHRPATFDAAYLLDRYRAEFDINNIPTLVKKIIFPVVLFFGKLMNKHQKYRDAPEPITG